MKELNNNDNTKLAINVSPVGEKYIFTDILKADVFSNTYKVRETYSERIIQ